MVREIPVHGHGACSRLMNNEVARLLTIISNKLDPASISTYIGFIIRHYGENVMSNGIEDGNRVHHPLKQVSARLARIEKYLANAPKWRYALFFFKAVACPLRTKLVRADET